MAQVAHVAPQIRFGKPMLRRRFHQLALSLAAGPPLIGTWLGRARAADGRTCVIEAKQVGIDVANSPERNTAAMRALRDRMIAEPAFHYVVNLPAGELRFQDAKWLRNVRSVTIQGGPTQLRNVRVRGPNTERVTLWINDLFLDDIGSRPGFGAQVNGALIETTGSKAGKVTLLDPNEAVRFPVGILCLVYGYNQTSEGYPPSMRNFEFRRVKAVRGQTVLLDRALDHGYRADWPDLVTNGAGLPYGKARILALNRPGFSMTEYCELNDLDFLPGVEAADGSGPSSQGGSLFAGGCMTLVGRRLSINGYFYPTQGRHIVMESCRIRFTEIDKVIDSVTFVDCELGEISNGPACNFIKIIRGEIQQPIANLNSRNFLSEDTKFYASNSKLNQYISAATSMSMRSLRIIRPILFRNNLGKDIPLLRAGATIKVTVLGMTRPGVIECAYLGIADPALRGIDTGSILTSTSTQTRIEVTAMYALAGQTAIEGVWSRGIPRVGEVFECKLLQHVRIIDPVIAGQGANLKDDPGRRFDDLVVGLKVDRGEVRAFGKARIIGQ